METFVFYLFGFLTISASWVVIYSKNLIYSAFALLFSFFGIAGLYGLLMADFLAATQVLIYVGGVLMLLLFGVMLTARKSVMEITQSNLPRIPGAIISGLMFLLLLYIIFSENSWNAASNQGVRETASVIGRLLMTDYLLPFEVTSILLLAALIGAVYIARKDES